MGHDHHYYDEYQNRHIIRRVAENCYRPANQMLLDLIREYGSAIKISFSISGPAIEQLLQYSPEVIHGFQELASTGCVEFLAETYSHSLAAIGSKEEFFRQVTKHQARMFDLFGQQPTTFRNTELIYSDAIGQMVADMGYTTMVTEGAKHIMGWKSPNFLYVNAINPKLKLLFRNFRLSDDILFRFSNRDWSDWPLTAEKFVKWLNAIQPNEEVVNLLLNYETLGEQQWKETGIFDFFMHLPRVLFQHSNFVFATPKELSEKLQPVAPISVLHPISWADEEKDITAWLGNELQDEAFSKLYSNEQAVNTVNKPDIWRDWERLQTSDHFYYMCTKWFSSGEVHKYYNPYPSPYEAFINYMNVLSDFEIRLSEPESELLPVSANKEIPALARPAGKNKPETQPKSKAKPKPKPKPKPKAKHSYKQNVSPKKNGRNKNNAE